MNKKVLVVYFSQSGQLEQILREFTSPLLLSGHDVEYLRVEPVNPYPFPWKGKSFFSVMPDCVLGVPTELKSFELKSSAYDLIIFGYQAWFLSPSIPTNSILNQPAIKAVLKNTPVITVTGARNMWISAMERVKAALKSSQAVLVGNLALVDKHPNFVSFVTILYWMFTGKKDKFLNIFPAPGVSQEDIVNTRNYGALVEKRLREDHWQGLQEELVANKAVVAK